MTSIIHHPILKTADVAVYSLTAATIMGWIPGVAGALSIIYFIVRIVIDLDNFFEEKKKKNKKKRCKSKTKTRKKKGSV